MMQGKKILIGITGSIAAYKTITLVRLLVKSGAEVKVIITPAAKDFVSPLTLATLSKHKVLGDLYEADSWANHVALGRWADMMLIAPLSCNTLAKMAAGLCDNLLMAVYLSATCPVVVAPAMDEDMWHHPATKRNLATITGFGNAVIPVNKGELASGLFGDGRMAEPEAIVAYLQQKLQHAPGPLQGKKVLVTAGPTYEPIDPVRFIGNHSSGKMGIALAEVLQERGALVTLVLGPVASGTDNKQIEVINVVTAQQMYEACMARFADSDLAIMAAAVADFSPETTATEKIKKKDEGLQLTLTKTKDILKSIGQVKRNDQVVVGFALETNNEQEHALQKLQSKNADMIVLNSLADKEAGFKVDTNKVTIFTKDGQRIAFDAKPKKEVANDIIDTITSLHYA